MSDLNRVTVQLQIGGHADPEMAAHQHLWEKRPVPAELTDEHARTIDEWRVTGEPGHGYPSYRFTFRSDSHEDPEASARKFAELGVDWADGPHLSHRTVTYSAWEER